MIHSIESLRNVKEDAQGIFIEIHRFAYASLHLQQGHVAYVDLPR